MAGLATTFGSGAMTNSIADLGQAACILAIGTNTTEAHPVIALQLKQMARRGGKLIVANPHWIELCRHATMWLRQRPGSDVALIGGMMRVIVDEGLADSNFIQERCENFDALRESLAAFSLERVSQITGLPQEQIREAARLYATSSSAAIVYAMGITQSSHGTDNVQALADLAMLTGNIGKPGSGVNPLRGHNNVQGSCDMGCLPNVFTGYQSVADGGIRERFEAAWGVSLNPKPGLTLGEIFDAAHDGTVKAIYLVGENPVITDPNAAHIEEALKRLEFLVVQDIFLSETARLAHVVLPAASFAEKEGTFTNTERRVQRVRQAISPVGNSRPDWWITVQLAMRLGAQGFSYEHPAEIMDEIARLTASYGGMAYHRLENGGLQWPCPSPNHPGTSILHREAFTRGKGHFVPVEYRGSLEQPDEEYPLILNTGRMLYHFHSSTLTRRVKGLRELHSEERVEINPQDAVSLGIADGDLVKVTSRRGAVTVRAKVAEGTPPGSLFMTFHFPDTVTNLLTQPGRDPVSKIPELKFCAVRVAKVA